MRALRLTFLGTGTSFGVPVIGCRCRVCASADPRDRRTRHSALLEWETRSAPDRGWADVGERSPGSRPRRAVLLVDTPPELRIQLLAAGVKRIDALWYTHLHADHVHGIDDVRIFSVRKRPPVPTYVALEMKQELMRRFRYIFDPQAAAERGSVLPRLELHAYRDGVPVRIRGARITPLRLPHGDEHVFGFRTGPLGYVTDAKRLTRAAADVLSGVDVLVLNALWFGRPHPAHFNVEEAVAAARLVGARRTFFTHLTHKVAHRDLVRRLPPDIRPAYDGLAIEVG